MGNPAKVYFANNVVVRLSSDNKLLDEQATTYNDDQILQLKHTARVIPAIKSQGYDYILLIDTEDAQSYKQVLQDDGYVPILDTNDIKLYKL